MSIDLINTETTSSFNSVLNQYLPLIIVIIAGFFALIQVRLNHIANYRLKWIEGFRNAISTLISETNDYTVTLTKIVMDGRKENNTKNIEPDLIRFQNALKNTVKYLNEVLLFLDPHDIKQKEIINVIDTIELACKDTSPKIEDYTKSVGKHFDKLINLSQIEISRQWKKTRKRIF